jgi:hypothetical protein
MRLPILAALLLFVGLACSSCSSDESDSTQTTSVTSTTMDTTTAAPTTTLPLDTATQLVDDWLAGWAAKDPDLVAAVFASDAEYTNPTGTETFNGRDEIRVHAQDYREFILNARRIGEGAVAANDAFVFRIDFDAEATSYSGEIEVELRDDLVARMLWLNYEPVN